MKKKLLLSALTAISSIASINASPNGTMANHFNNNHIVSEARIPKTTYNYDLDPLIVVSQNINEKGLVVMSGQFNKPFTNTNILLSVKYQNAQGEWVIVWCKTLYSYNQYNEILKATFELPASANPTYNLKVELSSDTSTSNFSSVVWSKAVSHYKQSYYSAANCDLDENEYTILLTPKKESTLIKDANGKVTGVKDRVTSAYSWNKLGNVIMNNKKNNVVFSPKNPATLLDNKSIKMINQGAVSDTLGSTSEIIYDAVAGHPVPYLYTYNDPVYMVAGKFSINGLLLKFSQWPGDPNGPGYHDFRNPNLLKSRYFNLYNTMYEKLSDFMQDQEPIVIVSSQATGLRIYKSNGTYISFSNLTGTSNYGAVFFGYGNDQGGARRGPGSENLIISNTSEMTLYGMGALRNDTTTTSQSVRYLSDIESEIAKFTNYVGIFGNAKLDTGSCSNSCFAINNGAQSDIVADWTRAPNSYIFTGKDKNGSDVDGLYIPVKKAYEIWRKGNYIANSNEAITGIQKPSLLWEDVSGLVRSISIVPGNTPEDAKIKIEIDKSKGKGNAVVALHVGANGTTNDSVYWSWHVWVTDNPEATIEYTNGLDYKIDGVTSFTPKFMDRNLGATNKDFLGHDWTKSNGLYYQWGRKDPFPSLTYKDGIYYQINSEKYGNLYNAEYAQYTGFPKIPKANRPTDFIKDNIRYSINNPLTYIDRINYQSGSLDAWFANSIYEVLNTKYYDLWGDNYEGFAQAKLPGQPGFKGYQLKSGYDPCPCNYRVPSHKGANSTEGKFSPWGRNTTINDDLNDAKINPNGSTTTNNLFAGIKIYPALGFDFTGVDGRNLGKIPLTGKIYANLGSRTQVSNNFSDQASEAGFWTASLGLAGVRNIGMINDIGRLDVNPVFGSFRLDHTSSTAINTFGAPVRCIEDPNKELIGNFETEFFSNGQLNYTVGINNPNSYIIANNQASLSIPINKAFAIYNQYLSNHGWITGTLATKVMWTTNKNLVKKVSLTNQNETGNIAVEFGTNNPKGNAVVVLMDSGNKVLWSWHIWAPQTAPTSLSEYTTETVLSNSDNIVNATKSGFPPLKTSFMDRDLGALQVFPTVANSAAPTTSEISQINESAGMLYQWGRKDPIPAFYKPNNSILQYSIYLETSKDINGNSVYNSTVDMTNHVTNYSVPYDTYGSVVSTSDPLNIQIRNVLKFSVENPLTLMYHKKSQALNITNWLNKIDWLSIQSNLFPERWGHGTKKSPFDPCPEGWRIPDVTFPLMKGGNLTYKVTNTSQVVIEKLGSSPWYYGNISRGVIPMTLGTTNLNIERFGLLQDKEYVIGNINELKYPGLQVARPASNNNKLGWIFNTAEYGIGNYPATGVRLLGVLGNGDSDPSIYGYLTTTGLWSATLGDQAYGHALALDLRYSPSTSTRVRSGVGYAPQTAMSCRCAKIEYDGNNNEIARIPVTTKTTTPGTTLTSLNVKDMVKNKLIVFPNPVKNLLHLDTEDDKDYYYQIYNMAGQLVKKGKFNNKQTDISDLSAGNYLVRINNSESIVKIIKQ